MQVKKADGSPCYTFEQCVDYASMGERAFYRWSDANGNVVATATDGVTGEGVATLKLACTGVPSAECSYTFGQARTCFCVGTFGMDGCGANAIPSPTACTSGVCP